MIDPSLFITTPPPLDPAWLAHEQATGLLLPQPVITSPAQRALNYANRCRDLNAQLLAGRDAYLASVTTREWYVDRPSASQHSEDVIPIRIYHPASNHEVMVIYFHGGGLYVGDLDSEDMSCRRVAHELGCTVYSVDYRLMPTFTAENALTDAKIAFSGITKEREDGDCKIILMGSSSGGQLAAQVSQWWAQEGMRGLSNDRMEIYGILLRGPVTCDASNLPTHLKDLHHSLSPAFHTSLLSTAALNNSNRTLSTLPLEAPASILAKMPKHWIQVCTNDMYYSDGVCYAKVLEEVGVQVELNVVVGWPHTFWLKAPGLERAEVAERDMVEGLRWLVRGEEEDRSTS